MSGTYYKQGSYNAICDVCGQKFKMFQLKKRWDGLVVCKDDFEHDHPQKFIRVKESGVAVPTPRPRPADISVGPVCYYPSTHSYADMATADCCVVDRVTLPFEVCLELMKETFY